MNPLRMENLICKSLPVFDLQVYLSFFLLSLSSFLLLLSLERECQEDGLMARKSPSDSSSGASGSNSHAVERPISGVADAVDLQSKVQREVKSSAPDSSRSSGQE